MSPRAGIDRRDVALAVALVVLGQVDAFFPGLYGTHVVGPAWVVSATYLVAAAAVLFRRVRPGTAFAVGLGALAVQALTVGTSEGNGSLLPAVVLAYSVAVHGSRRVAAGDVLLAPAVTRRLVERFARRPRSHPDAWSGLSPRERDVAVLVARGLSNKEIAATLVLSETTVKSHVAHVLTETGLRDRVQVVVRAYETGLVEPGSDHSP